MVKIDVISGFLGAGKTTFANLLLGKHIELGNKPVFVVNEFGQTSLDAEIAKAGGFEAVELVGGCICCTLKGDVATTIKEVIERYNPTNIVFEPSGIFIFIDFFEIIASNGLEGKCEVGSVYTIIDSVNFKFSKVKYGSFIHNQIKNAPIIILSKLEKTTADCEEIVSDIKNINPDAIIIAKPWSEWGDEEFSLVINNTAKPHANNTLRFHANLRTVTINPPETLTPQMLNELIEGCKNGTFGDLCRVKGIIRTDEGNKLLNIAMQDVTIEPFSGLYDPILTFIGQKVNKNTINTFFETEDLLDENQ